MFVLDVSGVDLGVEERDPSGDAVLLAPQEVEGDGAGVVGLHEFLAFIAECVAFDLVRLGFLSGDFVEPVELAGDQLAQRMKDVFGYLHVPVVVLDGGFDVGHEHGLAFAVGALGVPSGAHEVGVDDPAAALGVGQRQARATLPAVKGAFEVMVMGLGLLSGGLMGGEHGLHPVPDLGRDQRFV
nr:hypothetical protein [Brevibacterium sandarakinum]